MLDEIVLDDLRFQELVSEARNRIVRHAPEWTEHNVSDPGITLIELFAWFTEILSYRINRIPDRLHLALLELVGVHPAPPQQATVDLRFIFDGPEGAVIPARTEVALPRATSGDMIAFQTSEELVVPTGGLAGCVVQRAGQITAVATTDAVARPSGREQQPFGDPPAADDALLLGFDQPIATLVVGLDFDCSRAEARDDDPTRPRLMWEASAGDGRWHEAAVVSDETGAFLLGDGAVTVEIPPEADALRIAGKTLRWLRCRPGRGGSHGSYTRSPEITSISARIVGATVTARHAATVLNEQLGGSAGLPGSSYRLAHRPVLPLEEGETLEVRERGERGWDPWRHVDTFAHSGPGDRHFHVEMSAGEVRFGPAVRQPDGGWRHYGAIPPAGALMRFSRYRHGGGRAGNVAPRTVSLMLERIPGVASVTNPRAAAGGIDAESLDSARERARLEVRSRTRTVTADDFERLTLDSSSDVARAVCVAPDEGAIRVHVLPRVSPADRRLELAELSPGEELMRTLAEALDRRRLIGTSIRLLPVRLRGVSVVVDVRASPLADLERVQLDVEHALYVYLNPLIGGSPTGPGDGWPFGRALNQGELFGIVYAISGVEFVNIVRMYETDIRTGEQAAQPTDSHLKLEPDELVVSGKHIVKAAHRE
jgi:predicted phage baseplate assembly protein